LDWNRNKYPKFKAMFLRKQKLAGRNKAVRLVPDRYAFRLKRDVFEPIGLSSGLLSANC